MTRRWLGPRPGVLAGLVAALLAGPFAGLIASGVAADTAPEPARRIVTLAPHLAELVHAAGAGDRLVGTVAWSNFPAEVAALPQVGDAFRVDLEALAVLAPDLVLAWEGGNPDHMVAQVAGRGYRVVGLAPERLDDIGAHLETIGRLAGTEAAASAAAAAFRSELAALQEAEAGKAPLRVFYQVSWRPLYTIGGRQLISEVIGLCGGRNIFADLGELAPAVSLEAVLERNPEVILTADMQRAELEEWRRWTGVAAVRGGHLYSVDGDLVVRASPRILKGAREVCARLDEARRGTRQAGPLTRD